MSAPEYFYTPQIFACASFEAARAMILHPEKNLTTDQRWERETEWLEPRLQFPEGLVLDIGCGIGRIARTLVPHHPVLGVDISGPMRAMAECAVQDGERFSAISAGMLPKLVASGLRAQGAIAIWTLQHIPMPDLQYTIETLSKVLVPNGKLWTLDRSNRCIPMSTDGRDVMWAHDHISVQEHLAEFFELVSEEDMPDELCDAGAALLGWSPRP